MFSNTLQGSCEIRSDSLWCPVIFIWITLKLCFDSIITNDCKSPGTFPAIQIKISTCKPPEAITNSFLSYDVISGKSTYLFGCLNSIFFFFLSGNKRSSKLFSKISSFSEKLKHRNILKPHTSPKERHDKTTHFTIGIYGKTFSHVWNEIMWSNPTNYK